MVIKFRCPRCHKSFSISDVHAGEKAKCPCGMKFVIPKGVAASEKDGTGIESMMPGASYSQKPEFLTASANIDKKPADYKPISQEDVSQAQGHVTLRKLCLYSGGAIAAAGGVFVLLLIIPGMEEPKGLKLNLLIIGLVTICIVNLVAWPTSIISSVLLARRLHRSALFWGFFSFFFPYVFPEIIAFLRTLPPELRGFKPKPHELFMLNIILFVAIIVAVPLMVVTDGTKWFPIIAPIALIVIFLGRNVMRRVR